MLITEINNLCFNSKKLLKGCEKKMLRVRLKVNRKPIRRENEKNVAAIFTLMCLYTSLYLLTTVIR